MQGTRNDFYACKNGMQSVLDKAVILLIGQRCRTKGNGKTQALEDLHHSAVQRNLVLRKSQPLKQIPRLLRSESLKLLLNPLRNLAFFFCIGLLVKALEF